MQQHLGKCKYDQLAMVRSMFMCLVCKGYPPYACGVALGDLGFFRRKSEAGILQLKRELFATWREEAKASSHISHV